MYGYRNVKADALSRLQVQRFRRLAPNVEEEASHDHYRNMGHIMRLRKELHAVALAGSTFATYRTGLKAYRRFSRETQHPLT